MSKAARKTAHRAAMRGQAIKRTNCKGSVLVSWPDMRVTAATGDMVRPAADPMDTTAPTCVGSMPRLKAGSVKKPYKLLVEAMPDPHRMAKAQGNTVAAAISKAGFC